MLKTIINKFSQIIDFLLPPRSNYEIVKKLDPETIISLPKPRRIDDPKIFPLFDYRDKKVKAIIWELKYRENTGPLETIGKLMFDEILNLISDILLFDANAEFILIPVPISKLTRSERGYNQSELIARSIIDNDTHRTLLYAPQWLTKVKDTPKQSHSSSKEERMSNLKNSFIADDRVSGKYILVIDDVITTGSTSNEVKNTLMNSGAKDVFVFTIAH